MKTINLGRPEGFIGLVIGLLLAAVVVSSNWGASVLWSISSVRKSFRPIEAYLEKKSFQTGDRLQFKVHTPFETFHIDFFRLGAQKEKVATASAKGEIQNFADLSYQQGVNWKTNFEWVIPQKWKPGLYIAELTDKQGLFQVPFVVRSHSPSNSLVVLVSTNTWQAYNNWGGHSLYTKKGDAFNSLVHEYRPNIQAQLFKSDHLLLQDWQMLRWLEWSGFHYDLITDRDLDSRPKVLDGHKTLAVGGHAEYWTVAMYDRLDSFLKTGGNLLHLSGNSIYWKTTIKGQQLEVKKNRDQHSHDHSKGGKWRHVGRNEAKVLGTHYTSRGLGSYASYRVLADSHWVFKGTGLSKGDLFGSRGLRGKASGHETDEISKAGASVLLLARGENPEGGGADMTLYQHKGGGWIFSAGSLSFVPALLVDTQLGKMVLNVLEKMKESPVKK
jgi:hypothetical protein